MLPNLFRSPFRFGRHTCVDRATAQAAASYRCRTWILLWSGLADQLLFAGINTIKGRWSANSQLTLSCNINIRH